MAIWVYASPRVALVHLILSQSATIFNYLTKLSNLPSLLLKVITGGPPEHWRRVLVSFSITAIFIGYLFLIMDQGDRQALFRPERGSDETQTTSSDDSRAGLETEVDTRYPFRQGAPRPLCPMPVYTFCIGQSEPINWDDLRPHVHKVLKDRNIAWESISLFRRRHTARETNYKDLTVLITARKEDNDNWALAIYDLRRFFISQGQPDLVIEFLDERARRKTYPIRSSDPVNLIWPELRRQILVRLEGQDWVTMSLLRRGSGNGAAENPPTVLLGIKGRYDPSSEVTKDIEALCKRADPEVQLEVLEEADLWEPLDEPLPLPYRAFGDAAPMGSSVGVSGSLGTATLGGRILLRSRIDGDVVNVGITSFNLVKEHLAGKLPTSIYFIAAQPLVPCWP